MSESDAVGCSAPSQELVVTSLGEVAPCCTYRGPTFQIQDALGSSTQILNRSYKGLDDIFAQEAIPLGCRNCFRRESKGLISKRLKLKGRPGASTKHLEVSFSNLCNLDCVMCNAHFSSKLKNFHLQFLNAESDSLRGHHRHYFGEARNYGLTEEETRNLALQLESIESIEVLGGEPMLFKHLECFFQTLLEVNPDIRDIGFVTNGTTLNEDLFTLLKKFKKSRLIFNLSVDATGDLYRYIRGGDFSKVDSTARRLVSDPRVSRVFVKPTLSFINGGEVPALLEWTESLGGEEKVKLVLDQFLSDEEPLSLCAVPSEMRRLWAHRLRSHRLYPKHEGQIERMIQLMMKYQEPTPEVRASTSESIEIMNRHRKMNLVTILPELKIFESNSGSAYDWADKETQQALKDWVEKFLSRSSKALNNLPPCPYAKESLMKKEVGILKLANGDPEKVLREICQTYTDFNKRVLILWCAGDSLSAEETERLIKELRSEYGPRDLWVMYDHPEIAEAVDGLDFTFGGGTLFFIQKLHDLVEKANALEKQGYYKNWSADYYSDVVKARETQWNQNQLGPSDHE